MRRRLVTNRRGWVTLSVIGFVVASAAGTAQVWTNLRAIEYGYKISAATKQRASLLEKRRRLELEVAALKSPARIATLAEQWGMRPPEPEQVRRLTPAARPTPRPIDRPSEALTTLSLAPAAPGPADAHNGPAGRAHAATR